MNTKPDLRVSVMYPSEYLCAADLKGKSVTLKVTNVEIKPVQMSGGSKERKPILHLEKTNKKVLLGKTNVRALAVLLSTDGNDWIGKRVTISPDIDLAPDGTGECAAIRITGSPDATAERSAAFSKAWKGERKRGALIKRLKRAAGLLETNKAAIPIVEAEDKAPDEPAQSSPGYVPPEDDIFGDTTSDPAASAAETPVATVPPVTTADATAGAPADADAAPKKTLLDFKDTNARTIVGGAKGADAKGLGKLKAALNNTYRATMPVDEAAACDEAIAARERELSK